MSLSTSHFCDLAGTSDGEGRNQQATLHSTTISRVSTHHGLPDIREAWASELFGRILYYDGTHDEFFNLFVPCSEPYQRDANLRNPFESYRPKPGQGVVSYPDVVRVDGSCMVLVF